MRRIFNDTERAALRPNYEGELVTQNEILYVSTGLLPGNWVPVKPKVVTFPITLFELVDTTNVVPVVIEIGQFIFVYNNDSSETREVTINPGLSSEFTNSVAGPGGYLFLRVDAQVPNGPFGWLTVVST